MRSMKVLAWSLFVSSLFAQQTVMIQPNQVQVADQNANPPVYPANAGASVQQNIQAEQQVAQLNSDVQFKNFGASVFVNEGGTLAKRDLSSDSLKKAAVIFFGDWCTNCHKFLKDSAEYLNSITNAGIRLILVHVPSADKLRNWQDPTIEEYNEVKKTVGTYGINLSKNVEVVLLGERVILSKVGVTGLPVFIAVKDSKEFRREVGTKGAADLQDNAVRAQLMDTWKSGDEAKQNKIKPTKKESGTKRKKLKKNNSKNRINSIKKPKLTLMQEIKAKTATKLLNEIGLSK